MKAPATVHWTTDGWASTGRQDTSPAAVGCLHFADLPTGGLPAGQEVEWTFFWPEGDRWEGENFRASIIAAV